VTRDPRALHSTEPPSYPSPCTMATLEPWGIDDISSPIEHHPAITVILDTDIETHTAFKDTLEATSIKPIFESIIAILTLVRVSLLVLFPFLRSLISNTVRTKW